MSSGTKRPKSKLKYRHNFFDNDYDDYLLQYRPKQEWRKTLEKHTGQTPTTTVVEDVNNNNSRAVDIELEEDMGAHEKASQIKLKKEIEEIAKLENESSMAADLLKEIKVRQLKISGPLKFRRRTSFIC